MEVFSFLHGGTVLEFISGTGLFGIAEPMFIHDEGEDVLEGVEHLSPVDFEDERGEFFGL